jgi:hypothetical protein
MATSRNPKLKLQKSVPLRAYVAVEDHLRLKTEFDQLRAYVEALHKQIERQANELQLQFVRIAQMQAVLDVGRQTEVTKFAADLLKRPQST